MKKIFITITCILAVVGVTKAQTGKMYQAKLEGSVVLRDVEDKYNAQVYNLEAPAPDGNADRVRLAKAKEESAKLFPRTRTNRSAAKATAAKAPIVVKDFVADSLSGIPPDNDMAISKANKAVNVMNSSIAVLDGNTGQFLYRRILLLFSGPVGLSGPNDNRYDPKILYDPNEDRFICIMLNGRDQYNYIVVGFSKTNDPAGAWAFYKFYGDYKTDTTWFDYPGVVLSKDELFITGNKIGHSQPWETGFTETVVYQIDKHDGYQAAATLDYKIWDGIKFGGKSVRNLFPVKAGWIPDSDEQYFVSNRNFDVQNDTIFLAKISGKLNTGATLTLQAMKAPKSYGVPPNGRQKDTFELATNDGRILGAYAYNNEIQFVSTSVHPQSGSAAIYHGKISDYKSNPNVSYAEFYGIDTLDFGYPNISFVGNRWGVNQSMINFNYTGPNEYAGTAAIMYDGLDYSDMVKIKTGDTTISRLSGKNQRWGDYTGSQVDFNSLGSVWVVGIYGKVQNSSPSNIGNYGNWMAKLNSPVVGIQETKKETPQAKLYPNPAIQFVEFEFELQESAVVYFKIYNAAGQLVDELLSQKCKKGNNLLRFNIAMLPAGNYVLTGGSQSGETAIQQKFVKQ